MKVKMTGGYGDIDAGTYVDFADDAEAQRLVDLKCARVLADDEKDSNFEADKAATFLKVGKAKAAAPAPGPGQN